MENPAKYGIGDIPAKTLLHYVSKKDLTEAMGRNVFTALQEQARAAGKRVTAKFLKDAMLLDQGFVNQLRNSPLGMASYDKYVASVQRLTNPAVRAKSQQVRREMTQPRRGFVGCVATKLKPEDFRNCAENYDRPEYQSISLVPSASLKQSAYQKTASGVLAPRAGTHISQLPKGLKAYIYANPESYQDYLEERRAELDYLLAMGRNAREAEREGKFGKRVRGEGERIFGSAECDSEC